VVFEPVDLSNLVRSGADLIRSNVPGRIALHLDLPDALPAVLADRSQVQQVLMNLVINGAEAIGSGAGEITIRTDLRQLGEDELRGATGGELQPGAYVCLEVADSGSGMSEETRAKIFDPFFTTKFLGRGLGLAAVAGILRSHGGTIRVASEPGRGSVFTVLLPATGDAVPAAVGAPEPRPRRGSGTVLVVDDEAIVLETTQSVLEHRGYEVLSASSGAEAVAIFRREAPHIRLVILDLSMPGMGGEEVLPLLREVRRDVRVVISSGYSHDDAMKQFPGLAAVGFIQKPYTPARLAEEVARVLKEPARGSG
jgi:CheY-like chemotaxis protein